MHSKSPLLKVAGEIDELLGEVISPQKDFVARVCPSCEEACCNRVKRLFDEKDTLFAKARGRTGVPFSIQRDAFSQPRPGPLSAIGICVPH
ncbi:MAG: hypothetical protein SWQ30_16485 [Thermodesulfobacteriota bacterium]|nr:hypothetical protein [Thermodesulfobacteriota bacterium]